MGLVVSLRMGEWKEYELGDVINLKRGYDLPSKARKAGSIPIFSSAGITDFHIEPMAKGPGVITGRYGTVGQVFYSEGDYWPLNTTLYVQDFKGNNPKFIYYFLKAFDFEKYSDKSAVPGINRNDVHTERIRIPEIAEQKSIASILSCLDDKIDLLHRQNKTLEALAETLFRLWFVEEAEAGWETGKLGDYGEFKNGINYSRDEAGNTTYGIINVRDVVSNKFIFKEAVNEINIDSRKAEPYLLQKLDIVIVRSASPGETALILENQRKLIYSGFTIRFRPRKEREAFFFFQLMQSIKKQLDIFSDGTTLKNLNQEILKNIEFQVPSFESIRTFNEKVEPIFDKISKNMTQIRTLTGLRDTLLPKLMSGEVRVADAGRAA